MVMAELRKEEAFTFILSSSNAVFHQQKRRKLKIHTYTSFRKIDSCLIAFCYTYTKWYFPSSENDVTVEVFSSSGRSVSEGGLYSPRVGLNIASEARAVIETQEKKNQFSFPREVFSYFPSLWNIFLIFFLWGSFFMTFFGLFCLKWAEVGHVFLVIKKWCEVFSWARLET